MFATTRSLIRVLERERESFAAERARLVDQICALAGRPWTPPPATVRPQQEWGSLLDEEPLVFEEVSQEP